MGIKMSQDPARLEEELRGANSRVRELNDQIKNISRERQEHQRCQAERDEAVQACEDAEAELAVANQQIDALQKELASVSSSRDAERQIVENAKRLKAALEAL